MMNFGGKLPIFDNILPISGKPPKFKENLLKKGPLFREFWTQKPIHMGGTYQYPQCVMLPPGNRPNVIKPKGASLSFETPQKGKNEGTY